MGDQDQNEQLVELLFRNGTLTVVGIMLAFSLGFLTQWANNPIPWALIDLPTVALISAGIVVQVFALIRFLSHNSLIKRNFDRATATFVVGVLTTVAGVVSAILIDFLEIIY